MINIDTAVQTLVAEGFAEDDVLAVFDSMVDAGLEFPESDAITEAEMDLMRDELSA